jgi:hypothetical protein
LWGDGLEKACLSGLRIEPVDTLNASFENACENLVRIGKISSVFRTTAKYSSDN